MLVEMVVYRSCSWIEGNAFPPWASIVKAPFWYLPDSTGLRIVLLHPIADPSVTLSSALGLVNACTGSPPPHVLPHPGKTVPHHPMGDGCQASSPHPREPYYHRTRTLSGTEIAPQNERIQQKMRSKGCQCAETYSWTAQCELSWSCSD